MTSLRVLEALEARTSVVNVVYGVAVVEVVG